MSNATIIQGRNEIFIGSDAATSVQIDGVFFRKDTNAIKLYKVDDKIFFCSGELNYCYSVIKRFQQLVARSIVPVNHLRLTGECHNPTSLHLINISKTKV